MTTLRRHPLGYAPACGKQAVDQCVEFKRAMKRHVPQTDGGWLVVVPDNDRFRCRVEAVCDAGEPGAEAWAEKARAAAAGVWQELNGQQQGRGR